MKLKRKLRYFIINFLTNLLREKRIKDAQFYSYLKEDPRNLDNNLLISSICYESHHLEKMTKNKFKFNLDKNRYHRLKDLINEFDRREIDNDSIKNWAMSIIDQYENYTQTKIQKINKINDSISISKQESIIEGIFNRKSVRFWYPKLIENDQIDKIVKAGINGPISCNRQAFKICIIKNQIENIIMGEAKNASLLKKAPIKIYVAVDERLYNEMYACALDCGSFCANALLAARSLGIEGCWIYLCENSNQKELRKKFSIPSHYYFYSALLLGYSAGDSLKPARRNIDSIVIVK